MKEKTKKTIAAAELDRKFDAGYNVSKFVDWKSGVRGDAKPVRINVDFPEWIITALDRESDRQGITRQSLIKTWIVDRLDKLSAA